MNDLTHPDASIVSNSLRDVLDPHVPRGSCTALISIGPYLLKYFMVCTALALVTGCMGGGGSSSGGSAFDAPPTKIAPAPPTGDGTNTTADLPSPWNLFFVEEFDLAAVRAVRQSDRFAAQSLSVYWDVPGHPLLDGSYLTSGNAYQAARVDYAHSTGLTGAGEIVSIVDTPIRFTHAEFAGTSIYTSEPTTPPDFHGTAVASIAVGSADSGRLIGVAPGADLHAIHLPMALDFSGLAVKMDEATAIGAVASNNSWGIADLEIAEIEPADYWTGSAGRRRYVGSLRSFAEQGVIVFAAQNDYAANSIGAMHAIPLVDPQVRKSWLSVINVIPTYDEEQITGGIRVSTGCNEAAPVCIAASGQVRAANAKSDTDYSLTLGASFSAPQISGAVALLAEAFPTLTASQLRDRLLVSADNGWFKHDGVTEFAPGLEHGWSTEFGHGFLDLRAALLPLGTLSTPSASGAVALTQPAIISGAGAGDAIATSLAAADVVIDDSVGGRFTASADILAATARSSDEMALALRAVQMAHLDQGRLAGPQLLTGREGVDLLGVARQRIMTGPEGFELAVLTDDAEVAGLAASKEFVTGDTRLEFGVSAAKVEGSMLGVTVPGEQDGMHAQAVGFSIGTASNLSSDISLHFDAEFGVADGPGAGVIASFQDVGFSAYGAAVTFGDVLRAGDGMTFFARRPAAIASGSASVTLARPAALGSYDFEELKVGLAPESRQSDIGAEYTVSLAPTADLAVGVKHSFNIGNVGGRSGSSAVVGLRMLF